VPPLDFFTRKSGVYRLARPPCSKRIVTGCEVISAPASSNKVSVTKSRSSVLSCSTRPIEAGRKPVICDRLLSGMRRKPDSIRSEHQFAFTAHLMADSQLRHNSFAPKLRKRLGDIHPTDSRFKERRHALYAQVATNVIRTVMSPLDRLTPLTNKRPDPPE
jgi:hypothetical protein